MQHEFELNNFFNNSKKTIKIMYVSSATCAERMYFVYLLKISMHILLIYSFRSFDTPAEWVRHMNNQHTEVELALFNNKKDKEKK